MEAAQSQPSSEIDEAANGRQISLHECKFVDASDESCKKFV